MHKLLPACIVLLISSGACQPRENTEALEAIGESLYESNTLIAVTNEAVYDGLIEKKKDPQTEQRATYWVPKAFAIKEISAALRIYINAVKRQLGTLPDNDKAGVRKFFSVEGDSLYARLANYNKAVVQELHPEEFADNPFLQSLLNKDIESFKKEIAMRTAIHPDSIQRQSGSRQNWEIVYWRNTTPKFALIMMNKIEQDVLVTEQAMLRCIDNYVGSHGGHHYDQFYPLAVLSSAYVKAGQVIEVSAGIGAFSAAAKPTIYINGVKTKLEEEGVAIYNLKAAGKPGKYTVPVRVEFVKPDGSMAFVIRNLEYIIAE